MSGPKQAGGIRMIEHVAMDYPKPKRIPVGANLQSKNLMGPADLRHLLSGKVAVEEKMDGKPERFISQDPPLIIFAEDLKKRHSIFYHVPGRYCIFDIFDVKRNVFVYPEEKTQLSLDIRNGKIALPDLTGVLFFPVARLAQGKFNLDEITEFVGQTAYARQSKDRISVPSFGEGIVVKQFADSFLEEFVSGKIVRREFLDAITEHHLHLPYETNAIDLSQDVIISI